MSQLATRRGRHNAALSICLRRHLLSLFIVHPYYKGHLSLWGVYNLMTGGAQMTAKPNDAEQMTTNELMTKELRSEVPATFYELAFSGLEEPFVQ
mgnify:CR=1 FL=1